MIKATLIHFLVLVWLTCFLHGSMAQDIQFGQYYNLIQYQNPAFVGTSYAWRGIVHSRLQWPSLDARYLSTVVSADYNYRKYNSGVGAMFIYDDQGAASIKSSRAILQYSYLLHLNPSWSLRSGINLGFTRRKLDNSHLYYPDQFNGAGFDQGNKTAQLTKSFVDISAGLLLYNSRFWLGVSAAHLNSPNQSFTGNIEKIPFKFDVLTGYKWLLKSNSTMRYLEEEDEDIWALYPTVLYKWQGKSDQLDLGIYSIYKWLKTGLWFRGIPVKNYGKGIINNESFCLLAGIKIENISLDYSYDLLLSRIRPGAGGAHEINFTFLYPKRKKFQPKHKYKKIPCPNFYGYQD